MPFRRLAQRQMFAVGWTLTSAVGSTAVVKFQAVRAQFWHVRQQLSHLAAAQDVGKGHRSVPTYGGYRLPAGVIVR